MPNAARVTTRLHRDDLAVTRRLLAVPAAQPDRRRVIFLNRFFYPDLSATSQMLTDLVSAMRHQGFEIHVITSRQLYNQPHSAPLPVLDEYEGARVHRVKTSGFGRSALLGRMVDYLSFYFAAALQAARLTRAGDIIVALTDPPLLSVLGALVARRNRAVLVNWLHDIYPEIATSLGYPAPAWISAVLRRQRTWSLGVAARNVVLGERMRQFVDSLGVSPLKQRVIENWADGSAVAPRPIQWSAVRRSLGPEVEFVVQYSGNLGRAHEYQTLVGAAEALAHEPGVVILMVGDGALMQPLKHAVQQRGLTNVRFLPYQPREALGDSLAAADVHLTCLLPALEGLIVPSKFYGILAAGRPVIVIGDAQGEHARVVRREECGVVVACGDGAGLAREIRRMRADAAWVQAAGQRARHVFDRCYALDLAAKKWLDVLATAHEAEQGHGEFVPDEGAGVAVASVPS